MVIRRSYGACMLLDATALLLKRGVEQLIALFGPPKVLFKEHSSFTAEVVGFSGSVSCSRDDIVGESFVCFDQGVDQLGG